MFSAIPRNSITFARASISSCLPSLLATRMARFYRVYSSIIVNTSAAFFRHASYMLCLWLRFIFCPLQLCHFEGVLGSCFTLSLSLAPACCTERIDFSRWPNQLSASSSDTKETQKEKEATTTNPSSCVRRTRKASENDLLLGLVPIG